MARRRPRRCAIWALRASGADPAFFIGGEVPGSGPVPRRPTPAGARASGSLPRPTRATPASCGCGPRWRWSPTSRWTITPIGDPSPSCGRRSRVSPGWSRALVCGRRRPRPSLAAATEIAHSRPTARARPACDSPSPAATTSPTRSRRWRGRACLRRHGCWGCSPSSRGCAGVSSSGAWPGARVYDDYGHHPTEVAAAIAAPGSSRRRADRRLPAPSVSRTKAFAEEFGSPLSLADEVAVLDVYPAREEPVGELAGVSGLMVAGAAADPEGGRRVLWLPDRDRARCRACAGARGEGDSGHDRRRRHLRAR